MSSSSLKSRSSLSSSHKALRRALSISVREQGGPCAVSSLQRAATWSDARDGPRPRPRKRRSPPDPPSSHTSHLNSALSVVEFEEDALPPLGSVRSMPSTTSSLSTPRPRYRPLGSFSAPPAAPVKPALSRDSPSASPVARPDFLPDPPLDGLRLGLNRVRCLLGKEAELRSGMDVVVSFLEPGLYNRCVDFLLHVRPAFSRTSS